MQSGDAFILSEKPQGYRGAILCLHGLTGAAPEMERLGVVGRQAGFLVATPTLLGHRRQDIQDLRLIRLNQWLAEAEDEFLTLSRQAEGRPLVVAGLSFGALLALHLAVTHPERVSAVFACSPPFLLRPSLSETIAVVGSYLPEACLSYLGTVEKSTRRENRWALPRQSMERHSVGAVMRMKKLIRILTPQLARFTGKAMLLQDPHDHHLSPDSASSLASGLCRAEVEVTLVPRGEHELTVGWSHQFVEQRLSMLLQAVTASSAIG